MIEIPYGCYDEGVYMDLPILTLYYMTDTKKFADENGWENLPSNWITPNELLVFKHNKRDMFIVKKNHGCILELVYPY